MGDHRHTSSRLSVVSDDFPDKKVNLSAAQDAFNGILELAKGLNAIDADPHAKELQRVQVETQRDSQSYQDIGRIAL